MRYIVIIFILLLLGIIIFFLINVSSNKIISNKIIIYQDWDGLGDNLRFSTLPELYSKKGYKVYISSKNTYRNDEIYDLVWKMNPYVEGVIDLPENAGSCKSIVNSGRYMYIKDIELAHGFKNGHSLYPIIYYKPKQIDGLKKCILYDTSSISTNPNEKDIKDFFKKIFDKHNDLVPKKIKYIHKGKDKVKNRNISNLDTQTYDINSIFDLCDAIFSCKVFTCGFSGSAVLASSIKQDNDLPIVYSYREPKRNDTDFLFKNIIYSDLDSSKI